MKGVSAINASAGGCSAFISQSAQTGPTGRIKEWRGLGRGWVGAKVGTDTALGPGELSLCQQKHNEYPGEVHEPSAKSICSSLRQHMQSSRRVYHGNC